MCSFAYRCGFYRSCVQSKVSLQDEWFLLFWLFHTLPKGSALWIWVKTGPQKRYFGTQFHTKMMLGSIGWCHWTRRNQQKPVALRMTRWHRRASASMSRYSILYPLVVCYIAIENGPFSSLMYLLKMVIFHSKRVCLPEGLNCLPS